MKSKMLKKLICVTGLLLMTFPAWGAVSSNLLPTDSNSSQLSLTVELASPLFEDNMFLARGGGGGAGAGGGGAGGGAGGSAGAAAAADNAGHASDHGTATPEAATSPDTHGLEKAAAVVGTTPVGTTPAKESTESVFERLLQWWNGDPEMESGTADADE